MAWILEYQPTILLPGKGQIPFEPYPFQQAFIACRDRMRAINKPRQCGISTVVAAEVAWEFDNVPGAQIVIISKDKDAATQFHSYVVNILHSAHKNCPDYPKLLKTNQTETTNAAGARIKSFAASKETGRSFSATHLIFDEMAFAQYADDIWQASSPTLARTRGRATVISTPKGKANMFYRIFEAKDHLGFTPFNYGWWDVPDYNPYYEQYMAATTKSERAAWIKKAEESEWYKSVRPSKTELQWKQEFCGAFDSNMGSVFTERQIEKAFHRNYLHRQDDERGLIDEWWTSEKNSDALYACGIDLGRKNDPTVIITYDYKNFPAHMVDFKYIEAGRADWELIEQILVEHINFWQCDTRHDGTGIGDALSEKLYGLSDPFMFTKTGKQNIVERMQHAFDFRQVRCPKIPRLLHEHQRYLWDDKDLVQDTVMANGLAISVFYDTEGGAVGYTPFSYAGNSAVA